MTERVRYRGHEHKYDTGEVVIDNRGHIFVITKIEILTLSKRNSTTLVVYSGRGIEFGTPISGVNEDAIFGYQIPESQEGMI